MQEKSLEKIVVNMGVGKALEDPKYLESAMEDLAVITGQKPVSRSAKKAVSGFKVRAGDVVGLAVTLRGRRMEDFVKKLVGIVLPRLRDFRGLSHRSFDGHGNYSLGIPEHTVFPEIDPNKVSKIKSLEITIVTTAKNDEEGFKLLQTLGMPFEKGRVDG